MFIEAEVGRRKVLRLAWRLGSNMDWVWFDDDVQGYERRWSVLCGLALKRVCFQSSFSSLILF